MRRRREDNPLQLSLDFSRQLLPRFYRPANDNERLLTLQAQWLEDGREDARRELWSLLYEVSVRSVKGYYAKHGLRIYQETVEDKALESMWYIMRRYSNPKTKCWSSRLGQMVTYRDVYGYNYCVVKDFISVIQSGVRHAVHYRTKADGLVDYVDDVTLQKLRGYSEEEEDADDNLS